MDLLSTIIAVVAAVTVHEYCHAWMAYKLGDPTGKHLGRLSLNPLRHFDPLGTFALIFLGFGWGKPVPYNPTYLAHPKRDASLIALAGPFSNLITAILIAIPLKYFNNTSIEVLPIYNLLQSIFWVNVLLFSLNILPLPPFDGSKIIGIFIPRRFHDAYETFLEKGVMYVIIFILFDSFILQDLFNISILGTVVGFVSKWVIAIISLGT
ncbi:site-2 protease family protein [Candidatus Gracilibacteria bacterium]|nr:site-2 protease family protein [Candidatus Gracilibacteria bacterium]